MIIPLSLVKEVFRSFFARVRCKHHRAMNPDEKAWKDCCKRDPVGLRYRCCKCGKEKEMF